MHVIIDADALVASSITSDVHHIKAKGIIKHCLEKRAHCIIPTTAICEAVTVLQRRKEKIERELQELQKPQRQKALTQNELQALQRKLAIDQSIYTHGLYCLLQSVKSASFKLHSIDKELILEAMLRFNPDGRAGDTLFDAIVATLATRYDEVAIFSFDRFYKKMGLILVQDYFGMNK